MAKCDEGYLCDICGQAVENLDESELYLRFVIGEIEAEVLHTNVERHLRCNPVLSQFIDHPNFVPITVTGDFAKENLDPEYVANRQALITRGFERLLELKNIEIPIHEYPLPEIIANSNKG